MKEASEVELRCKIEESPGPPAYIYWYKVRIFSFQKLTKLDKLKIKIENIFLPDRTQFCLTQMHKNKCVQGASVINYSSMEGIEVSLSTEENKAVSTLIIKVLSQSITNHVPVCLIIGLRQLHLRTCQCLARLPHS